MSRFLLHISKIAEKVPRVNRFEDLLELSDFVFSLIPHIEDINKIDDVNVDNIGETFRKFQNKEAFGWCHGNANFLHFILNEYYRESYVYNFGLKKDLITHVALVVSIKGCQYFIDPYFNKYYGDKEGKAYTFDRLIKLIENDPSSISSYYGKGKKTVFHGDKFVEMTGKEFETSVLNGWRERNDLDAILQREFGSTNPLNLIPKRIECSRALRKRNGKIYYEFW